MRGAAVKRRPERVILLRHKLEYLRDRFPNARVIDPANTNNVISDDLTFADKMVIALEALQTLEKPWSQFIA
jgi:hypothetical protein